MLLEAGLAAERDDGTVIPRFRAPAAVSRFTTCAGAWRGSAAGCSGPASPSISTRPRTRSSTRAGSSTTCTRPRARSGRRRAVILVEGYFDVLRLVLAGIEHVVAPLGTALTADQATLLRRFAPAAVLLYDSDQAGPPRHLPRRRRAAAPRRAGPGGHDARRARIPTRWCAGAAPPRSSRCCATRWTCSSASSSCWSRRAGSRAWSTSATRSTGCCRPSARRPIRSCAIST